MAKFKTRARAVDMLGRQQIAGVPNAISELFKNAHDAYADNAVVDFFKSDQLFVLRDDGLGMTEDDFINRWLTVGTESKVGSKSGKTTPPPTDPSKPERPITGEKGIGRLSIAVIGPQVLILTRAKRGENLDDLVAAFIHWGLFEAPGVNLEQIEIPVRTFSSDQFPTNHDVQDMVNEVRQNVLMLSKEEFLGESLRDRILGDLDDYQLDLEANTEFLGTPSLLLDGSGTHFYILPARADLSDDINQFSDTDPDNVSRIQRLLLGFTNTMLPNHSHPNINTAFNYWESDDRYYNIIAEGEFFTPEEFETVDHHFIGSFDSTGQFVGTISIYGEEFKNYVIPWPKGLQKPIACGPFSIQLAQLPGLSRESTVPDEEYVRLTNKLKTFGGLYIYKDNIRILPYGDTEFDFLNIEKKRSLRAGDFPFAYRRMLGAIELNQSDNANLAEKAGREGFQDNRAYRDFKDVLDNFLTQIAAEFFQKGGTNSEVFQSRRNNMRLQKEILKQREEKTRTQRRKFEKDLNKFFEHHQTGKIQDTIDDILNDLLEQGKEVLKSGDSQGAMQLEWNASRRIQNIRSEYTIEKPSEFGLSPQLARDWSAYETEFDRLESEVFAEAQKHIQEIITSTSEQLDIAIDRKERLENLLKNILKSREDLLKSSVDETSKSVTHLNQRVRDTTQQISEDWRKIRDHVESEITKFDLSDLADDKITEKQHVLEEEVREESEQYILLLRFIQRQINSLNWDNKIVGEFVGAAEEGAALEQELLALQENENSNLELIQLGMSVSIITHEFTNTIRAIRRAIRSLRSWANDNPPLQPIYDDIYESFNHLDGYLTLFTPLNRRLYRSQVDITGTNIANYINNVFEERLRRHNVELKITSDFRQAKISGYPSTFYPVFVNLVDNSIFWLKDQTEPREITLDAMQDTFIVTDNGPGISARDREAIFELGFTRKPGGRGMGLYISSEVLKKEGFELELLDASKNSSGTTFIIKPLES